MLIMLFMCSFRVFVLFVFSCLSLVMLTMQVELSDHPLPISFLASLINHRLLCNQ